MFKEEMFGIDPGREELFSKIVALYIGKSNCLVRGKKTYISSDRCIKPYLSGTEVMLPLGFICDCFGLSKAELSQGSTENVGGTKYIGASGFSLFSGLHVHTEGNGLVIISKENLDAVLDWTKNIRLMRNIGEAFLFDDVTGEEIEELIKKRYPSRGHPRLIFDDRLLSDIRARLEDPDPVTERIFKRLLENAEEFVLQEPSRYELRDGIRLGYVCQENSVRMMTLALVYNLTAEEKFASAAYKFMLASAEFPDFNPFHFLDVGEMCVGLGLAYDWLYNWMSPRQRETIRGAIVEKGIYPIIEDFDDLPRKRSWNWREELADNWRLVISGVGIGTMAVIDELSGADLVAGRRATEQTLYDIRRALSLFAPNGAYEEGPLYWYFGMKYFVLLMLSLKSAVGSDFGYVDVPGMKETNSFMRAINGSVSAFAYHDCTVEGRVIPPETVFLSEYFGRPEESIPRINRILDGEECDAYEYITDLAVFRPELLKTGGQSQAYDVYLPVSEVATMRTGYGREDMWLGFHCDDPISGEGHDHMDSGTFVLDAMGESFFFDIGRDDYTIPGYLNCYRVRDEGHNVVVINPDSDYSMKWGGKAKIISFESNADGAVAVGDLSMAYRDSAGVTNYKRSVGLCRESGVAYVRDDIELSAPAELYWFAHTRAEITVSPDGRRAELSLNGKTLAAEIKEGESARFSVMDAVALPTSPTVKGQNPNKGIRKLTVHLKDVTRLNMQICFFAKQ